MTPDDKRLTWILAVGNAVLAAAIVWVCLTGCATRQKITVPLPQVEYSQ